MAEQSASQYSAGQVITAALHPLPANCLGVIASAAQRFSTHARVAIAGDALKNQHNLHAREDDIAFVFDKIDTCIPDLLKGVPAEVQERVEVWPCRDCCDCGRKFGSHRLHIPMVVYSSEDGKTHGSAVELHCDSCGVFFTGQCIANGMIVDTESRCRICGFSRTAAWVIFLCCRRQGCIPWRHAPQKISG